MGGQPGAARWEHAPGRSVDRTGNAPQVGVVVSHPSVAAIHLACRRGTRLAQFACHLEQRPLRLGKVTYQRRPVVHLGIDVNSVLRVPRCVHLVVPYTLQVGGLATGLTRRNQQITAILHHQRHHVEVGAVEGC